MRTRRRAVRVALRACRAPLASHRISLGEWVIGGDNQEQRDGGDQAGVQVGRRGPGENQKGNVEIAVAELS